MIYDIIIIGAGPAGLFTAANVNEISDSLIINNKDTPGIKLLVSGGGQCNITNTGNIKDFISRYGDNGPRIRKVLYRFSNIALIDYLESKGLKCFKREDGKVFPASMNGKELLRLLLERGKKKGFKLINDTQIEDIEFNAEKGIYILTDGNGNSYKCRKLVVATGGVTYPKTGSNGSILEALSKLNIKMIKMREGLVPVFVEDYPYSTLSGTAFKNARVKIGSHEKMGSLLMTHKNFSGPVVLDMSRYAQNGESMIINYLGDVSRELLMDRLRKARSGSSKSAINMIYEVIGKLSADITKRFIDLICERAGIEGDLRYGDLSKEKMNRLADILVNDSFVITGNGGPNVAMCTVGGVSLDEIDLSTFEVKDHPGLYIVGEALDVDGDTGGYNIQFAFSSGYVCGKSL